LTWRSLHFASLASREAVESAKRTKVFLVGKTESDAYLVGRTDSGWAGLKTRVVQT
jgi:hypothetical protein